ncbi:CBS domain-containing protein [Microvirga sp. Mcv34]|uniref:CBS domain-containing protein n=1 Tax=Microvirga sp. Mcv34 TaxID=2926016 RepID=UPI0021CAD18F|nr:CBS domain-containing protein [Microvirga sp. Mcv34]
MIVENVMTAPVISVEPSTSIGEVAKIMLAHRISGLPVVERVGRLVGVVSEGDLLRRSELGTERKRPWWLEFLVGPGKIADEYVHAHGRKVEEVMSTDVVTIRSDAPLDDVIEAMSRHRIKRLPVIKDDKLIGIVTRSDILRALARALPSASAEEAVNDEQIRNAIVTELARQDWGGPFIRVNVQNGAVELIGSIFDERERMASRVIAENVPGVKSVKDQLIWIEPVSGMVILPPDDSKR